MSLWLAKKQKSNEVFALQNALNKLQLGKPLVLDGDFGDDTEQAVRELQKRKDIKVDGIAGPHTLGSLFTHVEVTSRLTAEVMDNGKQGAHAPSLEDAENWSLRRPSSVSLGLAYLRLRQSQVGRWIQQTPPKPLIVLPPFQLHVPDLEFKHRRPNIPYPHLRPGKRPEPPYPRISPTSGAVSLTLPHKASAQGHVEVPSGMPVEIGTELAAEGFVSKELKEVSVEVHHQALLTIADDWLKAGVVIFPDPYGFWRFRAEVEVRPFKLISEDEWKKWTSEFNPLIAATVTAPNFLGAEAQASVSAGFHFKVARNLLRGNVQLFFSGSFGVAGLIEMHPHGMQAATLIPGGLAGLNAGVRF